MAVVELLLARGASEPTLAWMSPSDTLRTPLMAAALRGHARVAALLVDRACCSVHARNSCGATALHAAITGGHADVVKVLVARGASIVDPDAAGRTPLHYAARAGGALRIR